MTAPPGLTVTETLPFGSAQLMCRAARSMGVPTEPLMVVATGSRRERTVELEQVRAPRALSRFWVMVVVASAAMASPPARIRFLMARQSRSGSWALSSAATPVTCGVAMEVPLNVL
ncbi:MAG: hypothetical protein A2X52_08825 [Candidatus Rokubacteria bacterium GWC2_70_16]|nr:MAG: hypothetical protein A2X52_08825 [Candidatus Rokubacteria bacterium GWC2_70_16]